MRILLISMMLIGGVIFLGVAQAQQPGSLPTVVAKNTIPGSGDLDEDGDVDAVDAMFVLQIVESGKTGAGYPPTVRGFQQGDANHNGRLDKEDAKLIQQYVAGLIKLPKYKFLPGDADGNGIISSTDALLVARYLENLSLSTPLKLYNADANQDYFVDKRDVDRILCIVAGTCTKQ